jgi:protein arginine N-methyltransferase 1
MASVKQLAARSIARVMARLKANPTFRDWYASFSYESFNKDRFTGIGEQEKMLADAVRFDAYQRAIGKHVKKGDTVIDVGTGSGVLSFLAAAQEPARIHAIDHSPFIEVARHIATQNGVTCIEFASVHSRQFEPPQKVDVILHEQIGSGLFDENMVETLVDLRKRCLREGGKIVPARFELYMEPVQLKEELRVPFLWEHRYPAADYACLRDYWKDGQGPKALRMTQAQAVERLLADPEAVYACDLMTMEPEELPRELRFRKRVVRAGRLDAVCLFFRAIFDEEIAFATFPHDKRTHWSTPSFRLEPRECRAGEVLEVELVIGDVRHLDSWKVRVAP